MAQNIVGPGSSYGGQEVVTYTGSPSTVDNVTVFADTSGLRVKDSGLKLSSKLSVNGTLPMAGDLDMAHYEIKNSGAIHPRDNNDSDIGTSAKRYKTLYYTTLDPVPSGTAASVVAANGFGAAAGPALTLTVTPTGLLKSNGTAISAATAADVTGQLLTGFVSGAGVLSDADSLLVAMNKLDGNDALALLKTGGVMSGSIDLAGSSLTHVSTLTPPTGNDNIKIGNIIASGNANAGNIAIGTSANISGASLNVALGHSAAASGNNGTSVGFAATSGDSGTASGSQATAGILAVAIGNDARATGNNTISIGDSSRATLLDAIAIGHGANNTTANTILLGSTTVASIRPNSAVCDLGTVAVPFQTVRLSGSVAGATNSRTADDIVSNTGTGTSGSVATFVSDKVIQDGGTLLSDLATTAAVSSAYLAKAGGTMSGAIAMGSNAITGASSVSFSSTSGLIGTTTNDSAAALSVGEYVSNTTTGIALTTGTPANLTSVSLTAGDWDVWGTVQITPTAALTLVIGNISTTSATLSGPATAFGQFNLTFTSASTSVIPIGQARFSLSATTTVYLVGQATFTSTATGAGHMGARRVR